MSGFFQSQQAGILGPEYYNPVPQRSFDKFKQPSIRLAHFDQGDDTTTGSSELGHGTTTPVLKGRFVEAYVNPQGSSGLVNRFHGLSVRKPLSTLALGGPRADTTISTLRGPAYPATHQRAGDSGANKRLTIQQRAQEKYMFN